MPCGKGLLKGMNFRRWISPGKILKTGCCSEMTIYVVWFIRTHTMFTSLFVMLDIIDQYPSSANLLGIANANTVILLQFM